MYGENAERGISVPSFLFFNVGQNFERKNHRTICKKRTFFPSLHSFLCGESLHSCTANVGPVRIQYKSLVPIYVFPEMKLCGLTIS